MTTRKSLDLLLAEALEDLQAAAGTARAIPNFDFKPVLRTIGAATVSIWDVRKTLHDAEPDLRPEFVGLQESDPELCDRLFDQLDRAAQAEDRRDTSEAKRLYEGLLSTSPIGFFKTQAQAGLYRLTQRSLQGGDVV
jgi:hypothetical protein